MRPALFQPSSPTPPWTPLVVTTGVATSIGTCIPLGYHISVINSPAEVIRGWCNETIAARYGHSMSKSQLDILWSCVVSIYLVGGFLASLAGPLIADRFGRKGALIANNVLGVLSAILFVSSRYASSVEMVLLGRFTVGLASGLTLCAVPMYLTEIGHAHQRGALGTLSNMGIAFGIVLGQVVSFGSILGTDTLWNYLLAASSLLIAVSAVALPFLPESPKYLYVIRGDEAGSIKELSRLRRLPLECLTEELNELQLNHKSEQESQGKHTLLSVAMSPEFRMPLILVVLLQAGKLLSGIDAMYFYSTDLFKSVGLSAAVSEYSTSSMGLADFIVSSVAVFVSHRVSRKTLLLFSFFLIATFEICQTIALFYIEVAPWLSYVCVLNVVGMAVSYCLGLASIPFFIANELFVVGPSSVAMAYSSLTFWLADFCVSMTFPLMQAAIPSFVFLPYACVMVAIGTFVWYYLPETKDRNPKDVAEILKYGFRTRIRQSTTHSRKSGNGIQNSGFVLDPAFA